MIKIFLTFLVFSASIFSIHADSSEHFLQQLDQDLNKKVMSKYICSRQADTIMKLAMEEDLNATYPNYYLLSDEMLRLLKKGGVLGSSFALKIEAFQNHIDNLKSEEEKIAAIAAWKSLWLDKVSEHLVYKKSLKKLFTFDLTQSLNYDSNLTLESGDDSFSGKSDTGAGLGLGVNFRPFINKPKSKDWSYTTRLSGRQNYQTDENDFQYSFLSWGHNLNYRNIHPDITSLTFSLEGTLGFNSGDTNDRREFNQTVFSTSLQFLPFDPSKYQSFFQSAIQQASLRFRAKHEIEDSSNLIPEDDLYATSLSYGHTYIRHKKNNPIQTLRWNLKVEDQRLASDATRDYQYLSLSSFYTRDLSDFIDQYNVSWITYGSFRLKNWDSPSANDRDDEEEYFLSTGLRSIWTNYFSSSFNVSYRKRQQGISGAAGKDIDQWQVVLTNTFISL